MSGYCITVRPLYKGHWREPENVIFMKSCLLCTSSKCITVCVIHYMEKMKLPFIDSDLLYIQVSFIYSDLLYIQVSFNAGLTIIMFSFHFFNIFNLQKRACSILYLISILPRCFQILWNLSMSNLIGSCFCVQDRKVFGLHRLN
jgi:hypothetical protein